MCDQDSHTWSVRPPGQAYENPTKNSTSVSSSFPSQLVKVLCGKATLDQTQDQAIELVLGEASRIAQSMHPIWILGLKLAPQLLVPEQTLGIPVDTTDLFSSRKLRCRIVFSSVFDGVYELLKKLWCVRVDLVILWAEQVDQVRVFEELARKSTRCQRVRHVVQLMLCKLPLSINRRSAYRSHSAQSRQHAGHTGRCVYCCRSLCNLCSRAHICLARGL